MTSIPWNRINTGLLLLVLLAVIGLFASRAYGGPLDPPAAPGATDGVREPGTPISALPFTISNPGYYYLTRNLTGVIGSNGISIESNNVTLDLKGFQLLGASGGGSADDGVEVANVSSVTIRNGTISGWHGSGVLFPLPLLSIGSLLYDLHVSNNFQHGIRTGDRAIIHDVTATNNGLTGISGSRSSVIERCIVSDNQDGGIRASFNATITGCSVMQNSGNGIEAGQGSVVRGNTVTSNGGDGVKVFAGSLVEQNTIGLNGLQVADGAGVRATGSFNRITNNNVFSNDYGFAVADSTLTIGNYAVNNGDDYGQVLAGPVGPVLDLTNIGAAGANPHANFR